MPSHNRNHLFLTRSWRDRPRRSDRDEPSRSDHAALTNAPTFTHDIAPILYANCVECHRAGEIAPMSLITYAEVRPWAKAIVRQVGSGAMPPWHADAPHGTFRNERGLTQQQKDLLERWAAAGAPEGNPSDLPACADVRRPAGASASRTRSSRCRRTTPFRRRARSNTSTSTSPPNFTEEKWLQAIEARPGNRSLVHHVLVYYETPPDGRARRRAPAQPRRQPPAAQTPGQATGRGVKEFRAPPARDLRTRHEPAGLPRGHRASACHPAACCISRCTTPQTERPAPIGRRSG